MQFQILPPGLLNGSGSHPMGQGTSAGVLATRSVSALITCLGTRKMTTSWVSGPTALTSQPLLSLDQGQTSFIIWPHIPLL